MYVIVLWIIPKCISHVILCYLNDKEIINFILLNYSISVKSIFTSSCYSPSYMPHVSQWSLMLTITTLRDTKEICIYTQRAVKVLSAKLSESIDAEDIHDVLMSWRLEKQAIEGRDTDNPVRRQLSVFRSPRILKYIHTKVTIPECNNPVKNNVTAWNISYWSRFANEESREVGEGRLKNH